jgi:hypothetical protein
MQLFVELKAQPEASLIDSKTSVGLNPREKSKSYPPDIAR